jgi:hypothetical protein
VLETLVLLYDEKSAATKGVVPPVSITSVGGDPVSQSVPSLRCTVLPLHACSQVQLEPAHCMAPLQAASPVDAGQQVWPAPPQAHEPPMHCRVELQEVPLQHDCPGPPQAHVPFAHVRFVLQNVPLQQ